MAIKRLEFFFIIFQFCVGDIGIEEVLNIRWLDFVYFARSQNFSLTMHGHEKNCLLF